MLTAHRWEQEERAQLLNLILYRPHLLVGGLGSLRCLGAFLFVLSGAVTPLLRADSPVVINELAAAGRQGLRDEDGDTPDWVELLNVSGQTVSLQSWSLSEESRRPKTWALPATNLPPGECLVVFASGKNRGQPGRPLHANFKLPSEDGTLVLRGPGGELSRVDHYPAQVSGVSFGRASGLEATGPRRVLVGADAGLRYFLAVDNRFGTNWIAPSFDDTRWRRGRNGIGYDTRRDDYRALIQTDLRQTMAGHCVGLYLRIPIVLSNDAALAGLRLSAQYDDGFVAWWNGAEIARRNAPAAVAWNTPAAATRPNEKGQMAEEIHLAGLERHLLNGTNWLAVQVLNAGLESSDLLFRLQLDLPVVAPESDSARAPAYTYLSALTPGSANAAAVCSGPRIESVTRTPLVPAGSGQPITITARVKGASVAVSEVQLVYRVMSREEVTLPMLDDGQHGDGPAGDSVYGALIPAKTAQTGQMIRYAVLARDANDQSSRWPLFADREGYSTYDGVVIADGGTESRLPILQLFSNREARSGKRNAVAVFYDGEFYDNVTITSHGQISRGFPKHSLNLHFPQDHPFLARTNYGRVKAVSVLANYADKSKIRNTLAYEMIGASGSMGHFAFAVRMEMNGKFYSVAEIVERGDERFLQRLGLDPQGALYKMNSNLSGGHGGEKKTRRYENSRELGLLAGAVSEERPLEQRAAYVYGHVDLPQCISYLVAMTLISSDDHGHKNYYLYRDARNTGEWALLPWDVDLSWGHNWTGEYFNEAMFSDNPLNLYRNPNRKPRNSLYAVLFEYPDFRQMYLRRLRTVMDELLQPPGTRPEALLIEKRIRELMDQIDPPGVKSSDADLDEAAWPSWGTRYTARQEAQRIMSEHLPGRRQFLFKSARAKLLGDSIPGPQSRNVQMELNSPDPQVERSQQFISIRNPNPFAVDASGWRLHGAGVDYRLRAGTVIPSGRSLYIVANVPQFRTRPPASAGVGPYFVQGNWRGSLRRDSEPIRLVTQTGETAASLGGP
ncbi:MAG: CotH kinase family protein [Verrucomicrobiota bacterium]